MRKYHSTLTETPAVARRRSWFPFVATVSFVLIAAPWFYEGGMLIYAEWRTMTGTYTVVPTPRLDAVHEWWRTKDQSVRFTTSHWLNSGPWSPRLAVPLGIGWAGAMAVVFLRRVR